MRERGGWSLSPAYDLNPNPDSPGRLSTAIDVDDADASIENALSVAGSFRLSDTEARAITADVERSTAEWRRVAADLGLPGSQISLMAGAYETGQRRVARSLTRT